MPNLDLVDVQLWMHYRSKTSFKLPNAKYLTQFNDYISTISADFPNLNIKYYEQKTVPLKKRFMLYGEGTPLFYLFKLVPQDYFVYTFKPDDFWKNYDVDTNVISRLTSYNLNKYVTCDNHITYSFDYILFIAGIHYDTEFILLEQIGHWATSNHKHVVVKTHPYTNTLHLEDYKKRFYALYSKGIDKQYFHLVCEANTDYLVDNCYMLWTTLSGVGFSALLKEKPVSYFGRDIDYNYGPIAKFCKTPEEAYDNIRLPYSEIKRYFSWYYDKLSIDLHSTDWQSTLKNRLYQYFCLRKSPYEYLSS